jgi:hypothetical protein
MVKASLIRRLERLERARMGKRPDPAEIARFRDNLDCPLPPEDCDWYEDADGSAWCRLCNSGYLASARDRLRRLYERYEAQRAGGSTNS